MKEESIVENIIKGRTVHLREAEESDIPFLLKWRNSPDHYLCSFFNKETVSLNQFLGELLYEFKNLRINRFVICQNETKLPIGTIWSYDHSVETNSLTISIYIDPCERKYMKAVESYLLMADHYFKEGAQLMKMEIFRHNDFINALFSRIEAFEKVSEKDAVIDVYTITKLAFEKTKKEYRNIFERCLNQP